MTATKKAGLDFDLIDMDINQLTLQDLERILENKLYDIYAFGCIVTGYKLVKQVAKIVRNANPKAVIVAGNSVATSIPELLLGTTEVDIAVMCEGDVTFVELLKKLDSGGDIREVSGIALKKGGDISFTPKRPVIKQLDEIGFPDWTLFEYEKYNAIGSVNANTFEGKGYIPYPLNTARGCPFNCTFCYHVFRGERYRRYSAEMIIKEIRNLHNNYNCNFIAFWDELTFPHIKSVESMVQRFKTLEFNIGWEASARADLLKKEHRGLVEELKSLGCVNISFSLENANPEILHAINKKIKVADFIEQAQVLWKGGVVPLTSVIFGYPQETPESIRQTIKVCEECNIYPSVGFLLPLPGTPVYEWAKHNGYIENEVAYLERIGDRQDFHINLTQIPDDEFKHMVEDELKSLARKQGLELESVFKTTTYQKPKKFVDDNTCHK